MAELKDTYTSTGAKFFAHQEAMTKLRGGRGQPITTHVMLTDVCNHKCAFCSVHHRAGDSLPLSTVQGYLRSLMQYGLKSVILSGGGNPILYKCRDSGAGFNDVVEWIHAHGLEIGLITNGMPLRKYSSAWNHSLNTPTFRESWGTVRPETLDKLAWVRISMAGLDHEEAEVYVPDVDQSRTTLGFSYVAHDVYDAPEDKKHGKVSTVYDVKMLDGEVKAGVVQDRAVWWFEDRVDWLTKQVESYVRTYSPRYVRLLPNCLEPVLIPARCVQLHGMADRINASVGREVVFVQHKPPAAPRACYLGYVHPVLNCDGWVYPCDSCVLNDAAGHQFAGKWRVCRWDEVARMYEQPVRSLIADPAATCPGCVFTHSNEVLASVVDGTAELVQVGTGTPDHVNFI